MSWVDQVHKKRQQEAAVKKILESDEFKKRQKEWQQQDLLRAMVNVSFITCQFLEIRHGYKANGMRKFLKYLYDVMVEIGEKNDEEFFLASDKALKNMYGVDVLKELNLERLEEK